VAQARKRRMSAAERRRRGLSQASPSVVLGRGTKLTPGINSEVKEGEIADVVESRSATPLRVIHKPIQPSETAAAAGHQPAGHRDDLDGSMTWSRSSGQDPSFDDQFESLQFSRAGLWSATTIMFYRYFFLFLSFYGRALFIALRPLCFTVIFSYFFLLSFFTRYCRQLIMSKASAYGEEIWQVDSLPQNADRMFISLKSLKGFTSGRGQSPKNSMGRFRVDYQRINIPRK
jgi:hypothetical protein